MKRIHKVLSVMLLVICCITGGCKKIDMEEYNKLKLVCSYELIAAKVDYQTQVSGESSAVYLLGFGGNSGKIETAETKVYNYWYKREDGGILSATINMAAYEYPKSVKVVIYENDSTIPKVEIWRNSGAIKYGDGERRHNSEFPTRTEIRFTIPSGSFVNTYDLQGITDKSQ